MVANTGTYLDTPSHRFSAGADLAGVPLSRLCDLDGLVVRLAGDDIRAIDRQVLMLSTAKGRAVLLHTGWDRLWATERYGSGHPYLTADGTDWLVESGVALVGIDLGNIDDAEDGNRPAHTALLRAGIPIVEHLCGLDELPPEGFRFFATPRLVVGMGTFPVRVRHRRPLTCPDWPRLTAWTCSSTPPDGSARSPCSARTSEVCRPP